MSSVPGAPARYFPPASGRYDTAPALRPLGTDFGSGQADGQLFQLDDRFEEYRANKLRCLAGPLDRYSGRMGLEPRVGSQVARLVVSRLLVEHGDVFRHERDAGSAHRLSCCLTGEILHLDGSYRLVRTGSPRGPAPPYRDALDALGAQVQEDFAVVCSQHGRPDWLAAYHVCAPTHWAPQEKLGRCFAGIHAPVPGMEPVNRVGDRMAEMMVRQGPFVRFGWGIDTDPRLDRHLEPPPGVSPEAWRSPPFDPSRQPPFYLRVERQVIWGLPEVDAALFVIRPYLTDGREVRADPAKRAQLAAALRSMSPESRRYKGVAEYAGDLIAWLAETPGCER